jgi:general stress protein 26
MKRLSQEIVNFFQNQGCVIVSTIDKNGFPHSACKGIAQIDSVGCIYLFDLYKAKTFQNLKHNSHISITAFDEHKFAGYCLKGNIQSVPTEELPSGVLKAWEERITGRITQRLLKNIHEELGHPRHPEALLPKPQYLIVMNVEEIVDLTPRNLK